MTSAIPCRAVAHRDRQEQSPPCARRQYPAVLYGSGREALAITINRHDFEQLIRSPLGSSSIVELALDGGRSRST
jgi:ribosomal protein L25 (general stress protein Ctc)